MNENVFLIRDESIQRMEAVVSALVDAAQHSGLDKGRAESALRAALAAECPRCLSQITGEELLALTELPSSKVADARVKRLRKGCCANEHCGHSYYRMIFKKNPDLDWMKLFAPAATPAKSLESGNQQAEENPAANPAGPIPLGGNRMFRAGALIVVAILLLLVRQWYLGGRIPLIREPEKFRVDPLPATGQTNKLEAYSSSQEGIATSLRTNTAPSLKPVSSSKRQWVAAA